VIPTCERSEGPSDVRKSPHRRSPRMRAFGYQRSSIEWPSYRDDTDTLTYYDLQHVSMKLKMPKWSYTTLRGLKGAKNGRGKLRNMRWIVVDILFKIRPISYTLIAYSVFWVVLLIPAHFGTSHCSEIGLHGD
jgi:hypothetical protein